MKLLIELSEDTLNNILWHGLNISPHHEKELLNAIRKPLSFKEPKQVLDEAIDGEGKDGNVKEGEAE